MCVYAAWGCETPIYIRVYITNYASPASPPLQKPIYGAGFRGDASGGRCVIMRHRMRHPGGSSRFSAAFTRRVARRATKASPPWSAAQAEDEILASRCYIPRRFVELAETMQADRGAIPFIAGLRAGHDGVGNPLMPLQPYLHSPSGHASGRSTRHPAELDATPRRADMGFPMSARTGTIKCGRCKRLLVGPTSSTNLPQTARSDPAASEAAGWPLNMTGFFPRSKPVRRTQRRSDGLGDGLEGLWPDDDAPAAPINYRHEPARPRTGTATNRPDLRSCLARMD
jgi:hypothetical protein